MSASDAPELLAIDAAALAEMRRRVACDAYEVAPAMAILRRQADDALEMTPPSVMDKAKVPPSGDKHDYLSLGTYWWPNPDTPDGLPYVRRDGHRNPEGDQTDMPGWMAMADVSPTLALAWYLTGDDRYGDAAARMLRVWFVDEATRMNPHLEYGQAIPGLCTGRDIGIIDTATRMTGVLDAIGLLRTWSGWDAATDEALSTWMADYLTWLTDSSHGRGEAATKNNHAVWYDVHVAGLALHVGRDALAAEVCAAAGERLIAAQIAPDGAQPLELARTRSLSYSLMNLRGFMTLAMVARRVGVDLWSWRSADGRSIRAAVDFLVSAVTGRRPWPHEQVTVVDAEDIVPVFRWAALAYRDDAYEQVVQSVGRAAAREYRVNLTHPWPAVS